MLLRKKNRGKKSGTHFVSAGVEEVAQTDNVTVIQLPHDL